MNETPPHKPRRSLLWLLAGGLIGFGLAAVISGAIRQAGWFGTGQRFSVALRSPVAGEMASPYGPFDLTFSLPLDPDTLAGRVRLDGSRPFTLDLNDGVLSLAPAAPLLPGPHLVTILPGVQSKDGRPLAEAVDLGFVVRQPQIVFMRQQGGQRGLFVQRPDGIERLSGDSQVVDYAVEPTGAGVLYSASNSAGGIDLWWVTRAGSGRERWLDCGQDACSQPAWSPTGERFAFTRKTRAADGTLADGRIWTAPRGGAQASALFQDAARHGDQPSWSPDGRWLSFYDPDAQAVILVDLDTVEEQVLPSGAGIGASWSPAGDQAAFLVLDLSRGTPRHLLYRVRPASQTSELLLHPEDGWQDVGLPVWSAAGPWIALSAQRSGGGPARGLYRVASDGSQVDEIALDPQYSFGGPAWSPAGDRLLFQRYRLAGSASPPDLMLWSSGSDDAALEIQAAGSGGWLP